MLATWPKSAFPVNVPGTPIHSSALLPFLLMMMHVRLWTFLLAITTIVVLTIMRKKGRTATWMLRRFKCRLRGNRVMARPVFYVRRMSRIEGFDTLEYPSQRLHKVRELPEKGAKKSTAKAPAKRPASAKPKR